MHVSKFDTQLDGIVLKQNVSIVIHNDAEMYCIIQEVRKILLLIKLFLW